MAQGSTGAITYQVGLDRTEQAYVAETWWLCVGQKGTSSAWSTSPKLPGMRSPVISSSEMGWRESISLPLIIPLNEEMVELVGHHNHFHGRDYLPVTFFGAASPQLQSWSSGGNWQSCVLLGQGQWPCKANHKTPWPCSMAELGLYTWSAVGHSENTLELWCLQYFLSLLEMPSGYNTLGQVAWTPSLGVEALRKKVVRIRPSKKREGKEQECETENWYLLIFGVQSLRSLYLLLFMCPGFPESFQWVSYFLEASRKWAPLNCDSDLVLDPSRTLYASQTQT